MKRLGDLTCWDVERLEREAFTRDELRRELEERESDDPPVVLDEEFPF